MRAAGSLVQQELARYLAPTPEGARTVTYDVGTVTSLNPFTVSVRGITIPYAVRLQSYQQAAVNDKVYVLMMGAQTLVLGPEWSVDNLAVNTTPPTPPPKPPPPPPPATLVTRDFPITGGAVYRGDPVWGFPTGNHLNYGYSVGFQFRSLWLVDSALVRSTIAGKKVHSVWLYLHNLDVYRGTGTQTVVVQQHTAFSVPASWGAVPGRTPVAIWQWGVPPREKAAWLNITGTVKLSTFGGFCLPDGGSTNPTTYGYVSGPFDGQLIDPPVLRVNYWN